jgi:putative membrane protein insertion efficiency factor
MARNAAARVVLVLLKFYKTLVSPLFAGSCRYLPSCSDYMAEAVERHGAAAGIALGLRRLATCHPLGGSGLDPVPQRRPWRSLLARRPHAGHAAEV